MVFSIDEDQGLTRLKKIISILENIANIHEQKIETIDRELNENYCDPISLQIMQDPVMILSVDSHGKFYLHTYERQSIMTWLQHHSTDPKTQGPVFKLQEIRRDSNRLFSDTNAIEAIADLTSEKEKWVRGLNAIKIVLENIRDILAEHSVLLRNSLFKSATKLNKSELDQENNIVIARSVATKQSR